MLRLRQALHALALQKYVSLSIAFEWLLLTPDLLSQLFPAFPYQGAAAALVLRPSCHVQEWMIDMGFLASRKLAGSERTLKSTLPVHWSSRSTVCVPILFQILWDA